MKKKWEIWKW